MNISFISPIVSKSSSVIERPSCLHLRRNKGVVISALREDFETAIDDYLEMCAEKGIEPQKVYKGTFNVRISPELHRSLAVYAASHNMTLNSTVEQAIMNYVQ